MRYLGGYFHQTPISVRQFSFSFVCHPWMPVRKKELHKTVQMVPAFLVGVSKFFSAVFYLQNYFPKKKISLIRFNLKFSYAWGNSLHLLFRKYCLLMDLTLGNCQNDFCCLSVSKNPGVGKLAIFLAAGLPISFAQSRQDSEVLCLLLAVLTGMKSSPFLSSSPTQPLFFFSPLRDPVCLFAFWTRLVPIAGGSKNSP